MDRNNVLEIIDRFSIKNIKRLRICNKDFSIELEKDDKPLISNEQDKELKGEDILEEDLYQLKSPLVGLYYQAPGPGKAPFVQEGDLIEEGDILYIIEAMKMINEIASPVTGVVKRIYFKDEDLVQYDDLVMEIDVDV